MSARRTNMVSYLDRELGKAVKRMREARGLTLIDMEKLSGYSIRVLQSYERGESMINHQHLLVLARAMGTEAEHIRRVAFGIEADEKVELPAGGQSAKKT